MNLVVLRPTTSIMASEPLFISTVKGLPKAAKKVFSGIGNQVIQGAKEVPKIAQAVAAAPVTIGATLADIPKQLEGKAPSEAFKVPVLGTITPYGRRALDYQKQPGYTPVTAGVRALSEGVLDAALTGKAVQSVAKFAKPKNIAQIEQAQGGWEPGAKEKFDRAFLNKDTAGMRESFPKVPTEYREKFSNDINRIFVQDLQTKPQTVTLFRGESASNAGGGHFSVDPGWAKNFGDKQIKMSLPKGTRVYQLTGEDVRAAVEGGTKNEAQLWKTLFDRGYDAIAGTDAMNASQLDVIVKPELVSKLTRTFKSPSQSLFINK